MKTASIALALLIFVTGFAANSFFSSNQGMVVIDNRSGKIIITEDSRYDVSV